MGFCPPDQSSEGSTPSFQANGAKISQTGRKSLLRRGLDHAQDSGSLKKRRHLNCRSGCRPQKAVLSLRLVPWPLELGQGRWVQIKVEAGHLVRGPGLWEELGLVGPLYPTRTLWVSTCAVRVGAHVCDRREGGCPQSSPPGLPGGICRCRLAIRSARLTAPLLGAQHPSLFHRWAGLDAWRGGCNEDL